MTSTLRTRKVLTNIQPPSADGGDAGFLYISLESPGFPDSCLGSSSEVGRCELLSPPNSSEKGLWAPAPQTPSICSHCCSLSPLWGANTCPGPSEHPQDSLNPDSSSQLISVCSCSQQNLKAAGLYQASPTCAWTLGVFYSYHFNLEDSFQMTSCGLGHPHPHSGFISNFSVTSLSASFWISSWLFLGLETICVEASQIYSNWRSDGAALELVQRGEATGLVICPAPWQSSLLSRDKRTLSSYPGNKQEGEAVCSPERRKGRGSFLFFN